MQAPVSKEELDKLAQFDSTSDVTDIKTMRNVEEALDTVENTCSLDEKVQEKREYGLKKVESETYSKHD